MQDQNSTPGEEGVVKWLLDKRDNSLIPAGSERSLEKHLASSFSNRSQCSLLFLFSLSFLCPSVSLSFHPFVIFSFCPSSFHPLIRQLPLFFFLFTLQQMNSSSTHFTGQHSLFLTSFFFWLRLGGSTSVPLPGDSHSEERP